MLPKDEKNLEIKFMFEFNLIILFIRGRFLCKDITHSISF